MFNFKWNPNFHKVYLLKLYHSNKISKSHFFHKTNYFEKMRKVYVYTLLCSPLMSAFTAIPLPHLLHLSGLNHSRSLLSPLPINCFSSGSLLFYGGIYKHLRDLLCHPSHHPKFISTLPSPYPKYTVKVNPDLYVVHH